MKAAFDAAGDSEELAALIMSPLSADVSLRMADLIADVLEERRDEARIPAGYLPEAIQPGEVA